MDPNLLDDDNARLNQYCSGYSMVYKNTFVWDVVASSSPPAQPTRSQSAPASMITIAASSVQQLGHDDWPSTDIPSTQPLGMDTSNDIPIIVAAPAVLQLGPTIRLALQHPTWSNLAMDHQLIFLVALEQEEQNRSLTSG